MFEHLDDPLQRERDLVAEYGAVAVLSASMRRRRSVIVTTLGLALVVTGGVSGLALGGPDLVHGPTDGGPLLALGDPRSTTGTLPPVSLTGTDQTLPGTCPTGADVGHPASSAAVAVAVTGAVVVSTPDETPAGDAAQAPVPDAETVSRARGWAGTGTTHPGKASTPHSGSTATPHPGAGSPPSTPSAPSGPPRGGGVQTPDPVVTQPTDNSGGGDPPGGIKTPGGSDGSGTGDGTDTGVGAGTGDGANTGDGSTESPAPLPSASELLPVDVVP